MVRSEKDLEGIIEHLCYEYDMLRQTSKELSNGLPDGVIKNALVESFTLHARNMIDFLDPPSSVKPDDVLATDFNFIKDLNTWNKALSKNKDSRKQIKDRCNKEMAHLTYKRIGISEEDKLWPHVKIVSEIECLFTIFLKHIDRKYAEKIKGRI